MNDISDRGLVTQLRSFPHAFWMLNVMETLERAAYYGVRTVIPIYIAQADEINGLHFTQVDKGIIFFWWALIQSLSPMFAGGFGKAQLLPMLRCSSPFTWVSNKLS